MAICHDLPMGSDSSGASNVYVPYVDCRFEQRLNIFSLVLSLWLQVWGHVVLSSRSVVTDRPSWRDLT